MKTLSLFDALTKIKEGRSSEILDHLYEKRLVAPMDRKTNYVLAHALDASEQYSRAESVWETAKSLQERRRAPQVIWPPDDIESFSHGAHLQAKLNNILGLEEEEKDEMEQLIQNLSSSERVALEEAGNLSPDELSDDDYDEEDPVTETFARILETQKKYSEAAAVYRSLSEQNPDEADRLLKEAERLDQLNNAETDS